MKYVGYHDDKDLPLKAGDIVTIRKGVTIFTTHPDGRGKVAGRTYKIKIDHVLWGCTRDGEHYRNPSVRWPGSGGYWNEVDINDVPEAGEKPANS